MRYSKDILISLKTRYFKRLRFLY